MRSNVSGDQRCAFEYLPWNSLRACSASLNQPRQFRWTRQTCLAALLRQACGKSQRCGEACGHDEAQRHPCKRASVVPCEKVLRTSCDGLSAARSLRQPSADALLWPSLTVLRSVRGVPRQRESHWAAEAPPRPLLHNTPPNKHSGAAGFDGCMHPIGC